MRKTLKGLMTTVLTLAMMIGVFAVGGVQVKAAPTYELVAVGEDVTFEQAKALVANNNASDLNLINSLIENDPVLSAISFLDVLVYVNDEYGSIVTWRIGYGSTGSATLSNESEYNLMRQTPGPGFVYYYLVINETAPVHEHSYSWVTVREVTTEWDGIEEYRCSCGDVRERRTIPQATIYVNGLVEMIQKRPGNGDASFESSWFHTITDYIVEKLAQRSDATFVITFEYKDVLYKMTIPSGVDYSVLLADEEYFYGYFYFAQLIGATIEILE